ncbi:MAG: TolC family protein [Planctomycetes bacterium]|nr:TolC family protein [Planctomycetota bacterium]
MLRFQFSAGLIVLALFSILGGCISPLDSIESDVQRLSDFTSRLDSENAAQMRARGFIAKRASNQAEITESSSLSVCLQYALNNNAQIEAAFYRWNAALEKVPQVTTLPDPRLTYGYFLNEVETRVGPQQHRVSVGQMFPWFGKLELKGDIAAEAADAEFQRFQAASLMLIWQVKQAYYELYYLRSAVSITQENLQLLSQFERIASAKYRVAAASHPDLIRIQVQLGKLEDRLKQLKDLRHPLAAKLNAAMNRPSHALAPWPENIDDEDITLDEDKLRAALVRDNPQLSALAHEIEKQRHAMKLARKSAYPDVTVMADYILTGQAMNSSIAESGDDAFIAAISINLPIWNDKYEAEVRQAVNRRLATASQKQHQENLLLAELERAMYDYRDARRKITLYRETLIPKARESLTSTLRSYETAKSSFLDLLDTERELLEFELVQRRAKSDAAIALAKIEMFIAGPVDGSAISTEMEDDR